MRSFLSKISSRIKTKRTPKAPCDCRDFFAAVPDAPDVGHLRQTVHARQFHSAPGERLTEDVLAQRENTVRGIAFDLRYRCGGAGRCTCAGAPDCRFPMCFAMRPVIKGAEIQAERCAFEVDDAPTPEIRALVSLARAEKLEEVITGIKQMVDRQLTAAAGGQPLDGLLRSTPEAAAAEGITVGRSGASVVGVNPLRESEELRDEVISLYIWRAALLVNLRRDDEAVHSLMNLASTLEVKHRTRVYGTAAGWACLHDMEVIYYRSVLKQYEVYPEAQFFAYERPMLLPRVFEAMKGDEYHTEYCAHVVFSKEVTATVSRAQAAQMYGDVSEDPMLSLCIPLTMPYYRFRVGDAFWKHFYTLLCMPPVPPPAREEGERQARDPVAELGLTPNHILDAVGRSMLLHHLVLFADTRAKDIDSGAVAKRVNLIKQREETPHPSDYDYVLTDREMGVAVARMKQLLVVVKSYESAQKANLSAGESGQPREHIAGEKEAGSGGKP